ncbi:retrotransposon protein, putative, ty1-copia subclass, partial [Tanacetum coccineum]
MSLRRVHNSSCDEVVSGRGIGLGIIVNMDNSRESTAILVRPSHHVNANIDDEEEEYTPLRSLFDISPTPAIVYDDIKATGEKKTFCSIECRSMQIAQMEEESIKKKTMMRNKHDCGSSTSYTPQQVPVSRFSGHGHGQMCWIYVLDEQIPTINDNSTQEEIKAHQKHYDDANKVSCIMAASMSPKLQKTFEFTWAYEINQQLKEMFQAKASKKSLDVVKSLMACKPKPGASICAFVLEMKGYFDRLESLNMVFDAEHSINIILSGLPADYNQFVLSYQMNRKETSIMELHSLLKTSEQGIKKIDAPSISAAPVLTFESEIAPTGDPKEAVCFYCNTKGHWKRSCPKYLKDLKDEKVEKGGHSGMFMIELHNTTTCDSWVLDTGCGTHICTVLQGLKESRKLKHGELNLVMGNMKITPVTKIGKYELMLKSGVRIILNNCCYLSEMTRNIISFHALFKDGYQFSFDNEN